MTVFSQKIKGRHSRCSAPTGERPSTWRAWADRPWCAGALISPSPRGERAWDSRWEEGRRRRSSVPWAGGNRGRTKAASPPYAASPAIGSPLLAIRLRAGHIPRWSSRLPARGGLPGRRVLLLLGWPPSPTEKREGRASSHGTSRCGVGRPPAANAALPDHGLAHGRIRNARLRPREGRSAPPRLSPFSISPLSSFLLASLTRS